MKRSTPVAVLLALSIPLMAGIGSAGDEQDPEVAERCDDGYVSIGDQVLVGPPEEVNIRAAWFEGIWERFELEDGTFDYRLDGIVVTLQMCGEMDLVPPIGSVDVVYGVGWDNGDCRQSVRLTRTSQDPERVVFRQRCGDGPTVSAELPPKDYLITGDRLVVTIDPDGVVAGVTDSLVEGATLALPQAASWFAFNSGGVPNSTAEGDTSPEGRDFLLGQDKPPIE